VHVIFMWAHVQYDILRPRGLAVNEPQIAKCTTQQVTCDLLSNIKFLSGLVLYILSLR